MLTISEAYAFARGQNLAVIATVSKSGMPEAALVEVAVTPELEIIFDTINITRKYENLGRNGRVAMVIGWDHQATLQYEGIADEPEGVERDRIKDIFFAACPRGAAREGWPGLTYIRVRPAWIRFSNYETPRRVEELTISREHEAPARSRWSWLSRS